LNEDARDLYRAVSELVRVYQFRDRQSTCYYDLSVTQCYALSFIVQSEPMMVSALADELFLDRSTVSRLVGSLVEKGYVRRAVDPDDARAARLKVTRKGRDLHEKIEQDLVEEMYALVADYGSETLRATIRLLGRLTEAASLRSRSKGSAAC